MSQAPHTLTNTHTAHTPTEAGFKSLQGLVRTIRNARNEYNVEPGRKIAALVRLTSTSPSAAVFAELLDTEGTAQTQHLGVQRVDTLLQHCQHIPYLPPSKLDN